MAQDQTHSRIPQPQWLSRAQRTLCSFVSVGGFTGGTFAVFTTDNGVGTGGLLLIGGISGLIALLGRIPRIKWGDNEIDPSLAYLVGVEAGLDTATEAATEAAAAATSPDEVVQAVSRAGSALGWKSQQKGQTVAFREDYPPRTSPLTVNQIATAIKEEGERRRFMSMIRKAAVQCRAFAPDADDDPFAAAGPPAAFRVGYTTNKVVTNSMQMSKEFGWTLIFEVYDRGDTRELVAKAHGNAAHKEVKKFVDLVAQRL